MMRLSVNTLRRIGWGLAVASVIAPALQLGPLFAQPPLPLAVLWLAYGLAAEDHGGPRVYIALFALGLLHDQLSYNPYGVFAFLYVSAYPLGWLAARAMSAPNFVALWGGFIAQCAGVALLALLIAPLAFGEGAPLLPLIQTLMFTALLFPLVRPFYMLAPGASRLSGLGGRS
jgi:hypothetical protein